MACRSNLRAPQGQSRQCPHAPVQRCPSGPGLRPSQTRSGIPSARTGLPGPRSGIPVRVQQPTCASSGIQRSGYPPQRAQRAGRVAQYAPPRAGGRGNRFPENTSQPSHRPPVGECGCPRQQQPSRTAIPVMQSRFAKPAMSAMPSASTYNHPGHKPPARCPPDHMHGGASTIRNSPVHTSSSYVNSLVPQTEYPESYSHSPPGYGRSYPQNMPHSQPSCPAQTPVNQYTEILMRRIEEYGGHVPDLDEEEMPEYMYSDELEDDLNSSHEWYSGEYEEEPNSSHEWYSGEYEEEPNSSGEWCR